MFSKFYDLIIDEVGSTVTTTVFSMSHLNAQRQFPECFRDSSESALNLVLLQF